MVGKVLEEYFDSGLDLIDLEDRVVAAAAAAIAASWPIIHRSQQ
jgi:hypothetical protein